MVWIEFVICASLLTFFSYNLCKEGVLISEKTNIEQGIIGMFFLAVATSFPEIITASTAVASYGRIGLGYGDIVGSVIVNIMILSALDWHEGKGRMLSRVSSLNRTTGIYVLVVTSILLLSTLLRLSSLAIPTFINIGFESPIIIIIYLLYLLEIKRKGSGKNQQEKSKPQESLWKTWGKFISFLIIVMLLGMWMAKTGDRIVRETGLSQTFTGTLFLGLTTSLPEIIVSFAAFRAASIDMAVGNVLGSNLFDVCIVPLLDGLSPAPILGVLTKGQILATFIALILSTAVVLGTFIKKDVRGRIGWDTGLIFAVGLIGFVLLYFIP